MKIENPTESEMYRARPGDVDCGLWIVDCGLWLVSGEEGGELVKW